MRAYLAAYDLETVRSGSPTRSRPGGAECGRAPEGRERRSPTSSRTSTKCASASTASGSSTDGSASSRGATRTPSPTHQSRSSPSCIWATTTPSGPPRRSSTSTTGSSPGGIVVIEHHDARGCRARWRSSAAGGESMSRSAARTGPEPRGESPPKAPVLPRRRRRPRAGPSGRHSRPMAETDARSVGRRRLLQHAARGRADAPLAVARLPAGDRGPRLRGDRGRERLRGGPAARRGLRARVRAGVPLPRPRRRRETVARVCAQPRDRDVARRVAGADDRRRPRADPGRAALRHARPAHLRSGGRRPRSSAMSAPASRARRSMPATTRPTRIGSSSGSSGRRTDTACSRSATSSAIATGSMGCGRATACS